MSRKPTRGIQRDRVDYTNLLAELRNQKPESVSTEAVSEKKKDEKEISPARQRLMSSERVWYIYEDGGNVIHDKTCQEVRRIRDEDLRHTEKYLHHLQPCPLCQTKAYLRLGAKDLYNLRGYETLFERMRISPRMQRRLYVYAGIKTMYLGPGRLKVWGKEDTWLLEEVPHSSHLRLLHNNYCPMRDGARRIVSGYHEQVVCASARYAFSVITGYTYAGHVAAAERMKERIPAKAEMITPQAPPRQRSAWTRFKLWLKNLFKKWTWKLKWEKYMRRRKKRD